MTRHTTLATVVVLFLITSWVSAVRAQQPYPNRPIRLIVGFAPGGATDTVARLAGKQLSDRLSVPVIIDNRPGAGGSIGAEIAARARPDGYTLTVGTTSTHPIAAAVYSKLKYHPVEDFEPVALIAISHFLLVVHPSLPAQSVAEFISKVKSEPGKFNYASAGHGSSTHLAMAMLTHAAGLEMVHVPYNGSATATTAVMAGQVQALISSAAPLIPQVKAGRVRAIAIASPERASVLPDVPTLAESGFPGFDAGLWLGLFAPKGTPASIISRLHAEVGHIVQSTEMKVQCEREGLEPRLLSPTSLGKLVRSDLERYKSLAHTLGVKLD